MLPVHLPGVCQNPATELCLMLQLDAVLATSQALLQATKDIRSAFLVLWWRTTAGGGIACKHGTHRGNPLLLAVQSTRAKEAMCKRT